MLPDATLDRLEGCRVEDTGSFVSFWPLAPAARKINAVTKDFAIMTALANSFKDIGVLECPRPYIGFYVRLTSNFRTP